MKVLKRKMLNVLLAFVMVFSFAFSGWSGIFTAISVKAETTTVNLTFNALGLNGGENNDNTFGGTNYYTCIRFTTGVFSGDANGASDFSDLTEKASYVGSGNTDGQWGFAPAYSKWSQGYKNDAVFNFIYLWTANKPASEDTIAMKAGSYFTLSGTFADGTGACDDKYVLAEDINLRFNGTAWEYYVPVVDNTQFVTEFTNNGQFVVGNYNGDATNYPYEIIDGATASLPTGYTGAVAKIGSKINNGAAYINIDFTASQIPAADVESVVARVYSPDYTADDALRINNVGGYIGYDYDKETKSISINEEEAEIVRYIFRRYVEGAGGSIISRELRNLGYKTKRGGRSWPESTIRGILKNEKYKGDLLMGKTFTVDPISKRRLENMGEEDQFYLRDHHEPIISAELFNKAQEILKRRGQGRIQADGKREMFTRKYSLSCMIKCGFCGGSLTRRCWHSGTQYSKAVWQCVTVTKGGRKFCPDSKGIEEWQIEQAFVESYQMLCTDNKSIIDEFMARVEQSLSENSVLKEIEQLKREINGLENKKQKLLDLRLEELIEKADYELKYVEICAKIELSQRKIAELSETDQARANVQERLNTFRKTLSENKIIEEFDRAVFESVVDHVIIGGYDENGNKDPEMISFVYKTGFRDTLDGGKYRKPRKVRVDKKTGVKGLASPSQDNAMEKLCTLSEDDARGDARLPCSQGIMKNDKMPIPCACIRVRAFCNF